MTARHLVGYVRVGSRERHSTRAGRTTQRREIEAVCIAKGWQLVGIEEDARSGRSLRRPGLQAALRTCHEGGAGGILVAQLDRLTSSLADLAVLMHRAVHDGFIIVAPDLGVDLGTEQGAHLARVLSAAAGWQQRGVGGRPASAPEHRRTTDRRGRPSSTPSVLAQRIRGLRDAGTTLQGICDLLNAEGVPTPRGGTEWRPTSLRAILRPEPVT